MKINQIVESSTTAGCVAPSASGQGPVLSRTGVYGKNTKVGSLFKGKKTNKRFANSISEGKTEPVKEAELQEDDLIIVPGMRRMKDKSFIPHKEDRRDHEVEMARSDLYAAAKDAMRIFQLLKDRSEDDGLMGWQQSYITLASDYLNSVADSIEYSAKIKGELAEVLGGVIAAGGVGESLDEGQVLDLNKLLDLIAQYEATANAYETAEKTGDYVRAKNLRSSLMQIYTTIAQTPGGRAALKRLGADDVTVESKRIKRK